MRPFHGDIPNLSSFPTPTGTTSHANAGWHWRRMMASCPESCCQWMSPLCCHRARRTRRVGVAVKTTPSTTWAWSRKVSSTRAYFFPPATLPFTSAPSEVSTSPPSPVNSGYVFLWLSICTALSFFLGKNEEVSEHIHTCPV